MSKNVMPDDIVLLNHSLAFKEPTKFVQFLLKPFLLTWLGSICIFIGVNVLLVSSLFLKQGEDGAGYTNFWGMFVTCIGGLMYAASTFVNQAILVSLGGLLLTVGLVLYTCFLAWELQDIVEDKAQKDPTQLQDNTEDRAVLGICAMSIVFFAVDCFVRKSLQRMVKPYLGPANYLLYGALLFGAGAFCFFLQFVAQAKGVDDDAFYPVRTTAKFGSFLLSSGSLLIHLAVSRSYYVQDLQIVNNFPSVTSWDASPLQAFLFQILSPYNMCAAFVLVAGKILGKGDERIRLITAASVLLGVGYALMALVMSSLRINSWKQSPSGVVAHTTGYLLNAAALLIYALGVGLRLTLQSKDDVGRFNYSSDLMTGGAALGLLSSFMVLCLVGRYAEWEIFCPGNFYALSALLTCTGFFCLFLNGVAISDEPRTSCDIACDGSEELGYILLFMANMLSFMFFVILYDVTTIQEGECDLTREWRKIRAIFGSPVGYASASHTDGKRLAEVEGEEDDEGSEDLDGTEKEHSSHVRGDAALLEEFAALEKDGNGVVEHTDVLVIGSGPSGLTVTNEVAMRGVSVVLVERREKVNPDSRFFNLACSTMEGLQRLGVADKILSRSIPVDFEHGSVASTGFAHPDTQLFAKCAGPSREQQMKLGKHLSYLAAGRVMACKWAEQQPQRCMQSVQEQVLKEKAEALPCASVRYGWELVSFCDTDVPAAVHAATLGAAVGGDSAVEADELARTHCVRAKIRSVSTGQVRFLRAKYLVGSDGPGSKVSQLMETKFDGFINMGQMRTMHFKTTGLLNKIRPKLGDSLQYHIARPGYGVGWFVLNSLEGAPQQEAWTFFLVGLSDGRMPRQLSKEDMRDVLREFIGPDVDFTISTDAPWFWNMFFARRIVFGHVALCGDSAHSWPPFGGLGGNTCYADANNLGWKLAALCQGWGHEAMLESYDLERREAGLRTITMVLNFSPDRSQVLRMATVIQYPWLWWTAKFRWIFASTGAHAGNHMMSEGVQFGIRYHSNVIYSNREQQGLAPVETAASLYKPCIVAGGRIPHIRLLDGSSTNGLVALNGYTLFVVGKPHVRVTDSLANLAHTPLLDKSIRPEVLRKLDLFFKLRKIPLAIVRLEPLFQQLTDPEEVAMAERFKKSAQLILIRPDLYVNWFLGVHVMEVSVLELQKVAQISCSEVVDDALTRRTVNTTAWLNQRFITNIQGYRSLHMQAVYVENQDKAHAIEILKNREAKAGGGAASAVSLVTKGEVLHTAPEEKEEKEGGANGTAGGMQTKQDGAAQFSEIPVSNPESKDNEDSMDEHQRKADGKRATVAVGLADVYPEGPDLALHPGRREA